MADRYPLLMRRVQERYAQDRFQEADWRYDGFAVVGAQEDLPDTVLTLGNGDSRYVSRGALAEMVHDIVADFIQGSDHVSKQYDDTQGRLTLFADVPPQAIDPEVVRDIVADALRPGIGMSIDKNDATDSITFGIDMGVLLTAPEFNRVTVNVQPGTSYILDLDDAGKIVEMTSASSNVVTVPKDSDEPFPIGTIIEVDQIGAGQTSVTAATGVTLRAPAGNKISAQYGAATLRKRATDEWVLSGLVTT